MSNRSIEIIFSEFCSLIYIMTIRLLKSKVIIHYEGTISNYYYLLLNYLIIKL